MLNRMPWRFIQPVKAEYDIGDTAVSDICVDPLQAVTLSRLVRGVNITSISGKDGVNAGLIILQAERTLLMLR